MASRPTQRLVRVPRRPVAPQKPGIEWWLDEATGELNCSAPEVRPEEVVVAETEEQFDLLKTAVDAVEENQAYDGADNTRSTYAYEWKSFVAWCIERGQRPMPAQPAVVRAYVADVASRERPRKPRESSRVASPASERRPRGAAVRSPPKPWPPRKPAGLAVALAAIRWYHGKFGYPSPHADPLVQEEMERIRRRVGTAQVQKAPLTVAHLERIVGVLEDERLKPSGRTADERKAARLRAIRNKAIVLVGFAGAFRRGELAALGLGDVAYQADGFDATLPRSKTDQTGEGFVKAIPAGRQATCPKRALQAWLEAAGIEDGPIFREVDRFGRLVRNPPPCEGLSGDEVALVVKTYVEKIGLDPKKFSGHSLRAGLITAAAEAGRDVYEIMETSGHRWPASVFIYIRAAKRFDRAASRGLL